MPGEDPKFPGDQEWRDQLMEGISHAQALASLRVESRTTSTPPGSPDVYDTYIIPANPSGAWDDPGNGGTEDNLARWDGQSWEFMEVETVDQFAYRAYVKDEDLQVLWDGNNWVDAGGTGAGASSTSRDLLVDQTDGDVLLEQPRGEVLEVQ